MQAAGCGLRHEEYNVGDDDVQFLQIWIDPKLENITPRYQKRYFPKEKRKNTLQTIISNEEGQQHCWINQNAKLGLSWLEGRNTLPYALNPLNKCVYVFCLEGVIEIEGKTINRRDGIGLWQTDEFTITAKQESEFIVIEVPVNA